MTKWKMDALPDGAKRFIWHIDGSWGIWWARLSRDMSSYYWAIQLHEDDT